MTTRRRQDAITLFGLHKGKMEDPADRHLIAIALQGSSEPRHRAMAKRLTAPAFAQYSLLAVAEELNISANEIGRAYLEYQKVHGLVKMAAHLPDVMEQSAENAISDWVVCPKCKGEKVKENGSPCPLCKATGQIYEMADIDRVKLVFETAELIGKGRQGPLVNFNVGLPEQNEKMEDLIGSLPQIIEGNQV